MPPTVLLAIRKEYLRALKDDPMTTYLTQMFCLNLNICYIGYFDFFHLKEIRRNGEVHKIYLENTIKDS